MGEDVAFMQTSYIGASTKAVWQALVDAEIVEQYNARPLTQMDLKEGGRISYGAGDPESISGRIIKMVEGELLVHTFAYSHLTRDEESRVSYRLEPRDGATLLTVTHDGFGGRSKTYESACLEWPAIIQSLKAALEVRAAA
jgi:uncharacterized protein YndB with AHSA1/START domain